jgi:hypothetical protein
MAQPENALARLAPDFAFAHPGLQHNDRHTPRMRGIQYAAAFRFHHWRLGILDRPLFAGWVCGARVLN